MKKYMLAFSLALLTMPAWGDWAVKGEGNYACPEYTAAKRSNTAKLYSSVSWVQGFISGVNYQRALPEDSHSYLAQDLPAASLARWLETYCRDNPQDDLADAAAALIKEQKKGSG